MSTLIRVRGVTEDNRVILWERNDDHPDGEVFIRNGTEIEVAKTPDVLALLRSGKLVEIVDAPPAEQPAKPAKPVGRGQGGAEGGT